MFEILVTLCLVSAGSGQLPAVVTADGQVCRQVLLPGHETQDLASCAAAVQALELSLDWPGGRQADARREIRRDLGCYSAGKALEVAEVAPGVFVHEGAIAEPSPDNAGDVSNSGFIIGGDSVAVIDAGGSRQVGEQLYRAVRQRTDLPISHLILTHMHPDHVLGAAVFRDAGGRVIGHPELARALADRAESYLAAFGRLTGDPAFIGTRVILPDAVASASVPDIDLGGRKLRLHAWPLAHSPSDLTVLDVATGTLFTGDLLFDQHAPALDGSLKGWLRVLDALESDPVARLVPGHGGPVLSFPNGFNPLKRYLDTLLLDTREAIATGEALSSAAGHIGTGEAPHWALFDLYNPRNATVAYSELEWE